MITELQYLPLSIVLQIQKKPAKRWDIFFPSREILNRNSPKEVMAI